MSIMISTPEGALPNVGTALIPDARDIQLASESSQTLEGLAQATGDLTLTVTGEGGATNQIRVPSSVVRLMFAALAEMACGNTIALARLSDANPELTTQEAAEILNVSRPYVVSLLEKGEMAFRKVGPQRRVKLREVLAYKQRTDIDRRTALDELAREAQEMRLGYGE
jgi:excisionase family DNA binding protein